MMSPERHLVIHNLRIATSGRLINDIWRYIAQRLMQPFFVVKPEVVRQPSIKSYMLLYLFKYTSSYFTVRHSRSTKILSSARPRPSIYTTDRDAVLDQYAKLSLVNCEP